MQSFAGLPYGRQGMFLYKGTWNGLVKCPVILNKSLFNI